MWYCFFTDLFLANSISFGILKKECWTEFLNVDNLSIYEDFLCIIFVLHRSHILQTN